MTKSLQRFRPVFSGKDSRYLWDSIGKVKKYKLRDAVYSLGCACQRMESIIVQLEERIAELEKR